MSDISSALYFSKRALEKNPNSELALETQIFIYAHTGNDEKALSLLERLRTYSTTHEWDYHTKKAEDYLKRVKESKSFYGISVQFPEANWYAVSSL